MLAGGIMPMVGFVTAPRIGIGMLVDTRCNRAAFEYYFSVVCATVARTDRRATAGGCNDGAAGYGEAAAVAHIAAADARAEDR